MDVNLTALFKLPAMPEPEPTARALELALAKLLGVEPDEVNTAALRIEAVSTYHPEIVFGPGGPIDAPPPPLPAGMVEVGEPGKSEELPT